MNNRLSMQDIIDMLASQHDIPIEDAEKFIALGASRLGTSRVVKIVKSGVDLNDKSY